MNTQLLIIDSVTEKLLATLSNRTMGRANYYEAFHEEQLNGDNKFEFRMQADHSDAAFVVSGNYVGFKDLDGIVQLFQIYKTEELSDGQRLYKHIFAEHVFYELLDDVVVTSDQNNVSATTALNAALNQTRWNTGTVEVTGNNFYDFHYQSAISAIQQVAGRWGGELRFRVTLSSTGQITGRFVDLLTRRGTDTKKRFQFDRDMVSVLRRENMSNLKTALYGRGAAIETTSGGLKRKIDFKDIVWSKASGHPVDKPLGQEWIGDPEALAAYGRENGTRHRFGVYEDGRTTDPETLIQLTWEKLQGLNKVGITYQTDIVSLEEITGLEQDKVRLGDTIVIIDPTFYPTIRAEARIFELKRAIDDPENTHLVLGNFIELYTDTIEKKLRKLENEVADNSGIWDRVTDPISDGDFPDTPPPIPTNVNAIGNFKTIMVSWSYNVGSVIASYEVYASQVPGFTPAPSNLVWTGKSGGYLHTASVGQTWYFRVRSVNYHGTASAMSVQVSASTLFIGENEISDFVITNNMIAGNANIDFAKIGNVVITDAMITGTLTASKISIGPASTYAAGYDPSQKKRVFSVTPTTPYDVGDLWVQGTDGDLMRCNVARASGAYNSLDWEKATKYTDDAALANYVTVSTYNTDIDDIRAQLDQSVTSWFYAYDPTMSNEPASLWTDDTTKNTHLGDTFTNSLNGNSWRFGNPDSVYQWIAITDSTATQALQIANQAQDTADNKRRVFVAQPIPPYDIGDLWTQGTGGDLMVCITDKVTGAAYAAGDWQKAVKYTDDASLANYVTSSDYNTAIGGLQTQLDGKIETWFLSGVPTLANAPASTWATNETKDVHLGDLYFDTTTKKAYRFKVVTGTYSWELVQDTDIQTALTNAATAQSTANSKMQVFVAQPVPPYSVGDLWVQGTTGDLMRCQTAKGSGGTYAAGDWVKAVKYTDDSSLVNYVTTAVYNTGISGLQTQIDGKIETWFAAGAPTLANTPASSWTDIPTKDKHLGDLYFDTGTKKVYRFRNVSGTYSWELLQDSDIQTALTNASTAQATADGKSVVFTSQPTTPYDIGDLWAAGPTGDLMVCIAARAIGSYTAADWQKAVKYTDDASLANYVTSSTYTSGLGGLQTQIDGKIETWFLSGVPTLLNAPASSWADNETKDKHIGDLYFDTVTKKAYRFKVVTGTYSWELVQDVDVQTALTNASTAQSTADAKMQVFVAQPIPPYDIGDLWVQGTSGDLMRCSVAKPTGTFSASDWVKAVKYTDDSSLVNYVTSATYNGGLASLQTQVDSKVETWFASGAPTLANAPASSWTDNATKDLHLGDLYFDTATKKAYRFRSVTGVYSWELMQDTDIQTALTNASTAQSTADGKAVVFVSQPTTPYDIGDLWVQGTGGDLMRCSVARASGAYNSADWVKAVKYTDDASLANYVTSSTYNTAMGDIQAQLDGKIETWFLLGTPTLSNAPASTWTDNPTKDKHLGDLYFDTSSKKAYRFKVDTGIYSWELVQDTDIQTALSNASTAQSTADSKMQVFVAQPVPPYDIGDLWVQGTTGDLMRCQTAKPTGVYSAADWVKAVKYTDDSSLANYVTSTTYNNGIGGLQTQIDGKIETWFLSGAPTLANSPASTWTTNAIKDVHLGDLYFDTATKKVYRFKVVTGTYSWELLQDSDIQTALTNASTAQATADSKMQVFVAQPTTPYDVGDLWAGGPSGDLMKCKVARASGAFVAADWENATKYTDDTAANNIIVGGTNLIPNSTDIPIVALSASGTVTKSSAKSPLDGADVSNATTLATTTATTYRFNNIVPENATYTFSIYMKNSVVGNATVGMDICDGTVKNVTVTNTWTRFFITATVANWSSATYHFVDINPPVSSTIYLWRPKLERGNKMTDWSPSFEDADYEISTLQSRVSDVEINLGQDSITQKVMSATSFQYALSGKADNGDLENYVLGTDFNEFKDGLPDDIAEAISAIDFSPYVKNTQLQQTTSDITASFKHGGGVNLLKNSTGLADFDFWAKGGTATNALNIVTNNALEKLGFYNGFYFTPSDAGTSKDMVQTINVIPNEPITISWYINKMNNSPAANTDGAIWIEILNLEDTVVSSTSYSSDKVTDGYVSGDVTYTPTESQVIIRLTSLSLTEAVITGIMVNIGKYPLQWTMASGEIYNTNVKFDINGIKVSQFNDDGKEENRTIMTPEKFAGFYDVNGDGVIDTTEGSVDEVFRMDKDEFVQKKAVVKEEMTMGNIKLIKIDSTSYNGWAFVPNQ